MSTTLRIEKVWQDKFDDTWVAQVINDRGELQATVYGEDEQQARSRAVSVIVASEAGEALRASEKLLDDLRKTVIASSSTDGTATGVVGRDREYLDTIIAALTKIRRVWVMAKNGGAA